MHNLVKNDTSKTAVKKTRTKKDVPITKKKFKLRMKTDKISENLSGDNACNEVIVPVSNTVMQLTVKTQRPKLNINLTDNKNLIQQKTIVEDLDNEKELRLGDISIFKVKRSRLLPINIESLESEKKSTKYTIEPQFVQKFVTNSQKSLNESVPIEVKFTSSNINQLCDEKVDKNINSLDEVSVDDSDNSLSNCIIFSNNGRCALQNCDSKSDSLLLYGIDENRFLAICADHSVPDDFMLTPTTNENQNLSDSLLSQNLPSINIESPKDDFKDISESSKINELSTEEMKNRTNADEPMNLITPSYVLEKSLHESGDSTTPSFLTVKAGEEVLNELENIKPKTLKQTLNSMSKNDMFRSSNSESVVIYSNDDFSSMMDLDGSDLSFSAPNLNNSFCLADTEITCPICDKVFHNMDAYVTHLECDHN